ncbi:hypothetical protein [Paenibacillus chitinolyticus]|uniref:hypothetical protein n=1 Tax=Paenibacillus chitinolyticus TaxID=79263 RepID=UPI003CFF3AF0
MTKSKNQQRTRRNKEYLVITRDPENYKIFDLRANKPICYKDSPITGGDGSMVLQEIEYIESSRKINEMNNDLEYFAPNNVGILLSIARKSLDSALNTFEEKLNPERIDHVISKQDGDRKEQIINQSKIMYDYIEFIQSSIVFGFTALEAFVNLSIPEGYEYKFENNKGIIEVYNKEAIERWLPLRTKIAEILVSIYNTKPIKSINLWNMFCSFEEHRNEIIHQKSITHTNFYKKYFKKQIFELCSTPQGIIKFFFEERSPKNGTNALWPWVINTDNDFPINYEYKSEQFEITGNIYEGRSKK